MPRSVSFSVRRAAIAMSTALSVTALGAVGLGGAGGVGIQTAQAAESKTVLKSGHIDAFNVSASGNKLRLQLKEDVTGTHVKRNPENVELCVTKKAWTSQTSGVSFIGKGSYFLPQGSDGSNTIWPGWDTSDVRGSGAKSVDIKIASLQGPGKVYLWQNGNLGGNGQPVTGNYQLRSGAKINVPSPAHVHANWAFTKPGRYTMQVQAKADNGATSQTATYNWTVEGDGVSCGQGSNAGSAGAGTVGKSNAGKNTGTSVATEKESTARGGGIVSGIKNAAHEGSSAPTCKKGEPALRARVKDDRQSPPVWRTPNSLTFGLGGAAKAQLPQSLGPIKKGTVWMIGATQQNGVPWLGTNTMNPKLLAHTTGDVTFKLSSFSGPGNMFVYEQGNLGQVVGNKWFQATGGQVSGAHKVPRNSHVHPNWVFDKPGTYKVGITQTATLKNGKKISAPAVLTFKVGGSGNANSGHFDFGADVTTNGDCEASGAAGGGASGSGASDAAGSSAGGSGSSAGGADGQSDDSLADTGMTTGTLPMLAVGLGITVLGAGIIYYLRSSQAILRTYGRR